MKHGTDRRVYWSDAHHKLLRCVAQRVCREFGLRRKGKGDLWGITMAELVNIGWLRALRRRRPDELRGCYRLLLHIMRTAAMNIQNWQGEEARHAHPVTVHRVADIDDCFVKGRFLYVAPHPVCDDPDSAAEPAGLRARALRVG